MQQDVQFSYDDIWKLYEANDTPECPSVAQDGWTDGVELEETAPPWVRVISRRDPFPPCAALAYWPRNYNAGELADLNPEEEEEEDPERFVFSDGEMEAWIDCVHLVADEALGPKLPLGASSQQVVKEAPRNGVSEVIEMADEERVTRSSTHRSSTESNAPPVRKISAGGVKLAIWANEGPRGGTFHSVTLERTFRRQDEGAEGGWASTRALRVNDIPKAIAVLQKAYEWLVLRDSDSPDDGLPERLPAAALHDLEAVLSHAVAHAIESASASPSEGEATE